MSPITGADGVAAKPKEMTSVDPEWRRCLRLSVAISEADTKATEISAFDTRSAANTRSTTRRARARLKVVVSPSTATWIGGCGRDAGTSPSRRLLSRVGFDDVAHESMADDVGLVEVVEGDAVDAGKNA